MVTKSFFFQVLKIFRRNSDGVTSTEALNTGGAYKFHDFRPMSGYMWETIQDRAIVTMER